MLEPRINVHRAQGTVSKSDINIRIRNNYNLALCLSKKSLGKIVAHQNVTEPAKFHKLTQEYSWHRHSLLELAREHTYPQGGGPSLLLGTWLAVTCEVVLSEQRSLSVTPLHLLVMRACRNTS